MPYCPDCGEEVDEDMEFCANCGASLEGESSGTQGGRSGRRSGRTSLDMEENLEGALCYVLTWLTGIIFFVLEEESDFVRFHAMQSIVTFLPLFVLNMLLSPWIFGFRLFSLVSTLSTLVWILIIVLIVVLAVKAYQGERFKLPIAGDIAENQI